jgi:hypothetical protein
MFELPAVWNGTLREHYLILFGAAGAIGLIAGIVGAWLGARYGMRHMAERILASLPSAERQELTSLQLSQLTQAVDVISIEVERLAEGQRYTSKLLTDRSARHSGVPSDRPPGVITPH